MKSSSGKILQLLVVILMITGCKKNYVVSGKQEILFQLDYINYSYGYQHKGFFIDYEGNVLTYNSPQVWNFHDTDLTLTTSQVEENIGFCLHSGLRIPSEELNKYTNYIKNIALSKVTALKNVAADAGSVEFICYQLSESTGIYKGFIIKREGDFTCENLNFYSKRTAAWMKDINNSLYRK